MPASLLEMLVLEECRRRLGLSAAERDQALRQAGLRTDYFDPASYVYPRDEKLITGAHPVLAAVARSMCAFAYATVRSCSVGSTAAAALMATACSTEGCQSHTEAATSARNLQQCRHCFRTYCTRCMSASEMRILEYRWLRGQAVCLRCVAHLARVEAVLAELTNLRGAQRPRACEASRKENVSLIVDRGVRRC